MTTASPVSYTSTAGSMNGVEKRGLPGAPITRRRASSIRSRMCSNCELTSDVRRLVGMWLPRRLDDHLDLDGDVHRQLRHPDRAARVRASLAEHVEQQAGGAV